MNNEPKDVSRRGWRRTAGSLNWWMLLLAASLLPCPTRAAGGSVYDDFSSTAGLVLQGYAAPFDGHLRLTPAVGGRGRGGAWLDAKQRVEDGFETTFQIQITDKYVYGADGLAFVIQGAPAPGLGAGGGNLCFGGLTNLLVVKFDDYHWRDKVFAAFDEIAVEAADSPLTPLWDEARNAIASASRGVVFSDGRIHTVKIIYVPGNLEVYLDDRENPLMTAGVDLATVMDLDEGRAWVGFTAAGGADWQNQDLVSWSFFAGDPSSSARRMTPSDPGHADAAPRFSAPGPSAPDAKPLVEDRVFGYGIPRDVASKLNIETSDDLVHWLPLAHAAFFFKDPDSTNHPARFYRFSPD